MTATVRAVLPPYLPPYLGVQIASEAFVLDGALMDNVSAVLRRCGRAALAPQRAPRADCDRLAHLMVERGDSVLVALLGLRVAEGAGWPAPQVAALRKELEALRTPFADWAQPHGCAAAQAQGRYFDTLAREGELAAMRAAGASVSSPAPHGPR